MEDPTAVIPETEAVAPVPSREGIARGPIAIEVRGLDKAFRIPERRVDSIKERVLHPLTRIEYRSLQALRDVSFDVHQGEFFGIVGRNGSGKSTLLKIIASIYSADAGRVRAAGRVAPFIELGVGFNPELTARENGVLNGVLMGLTLREARHRLDSILDFGELRDFVDLKIKNYSSGMMVRLAFAVMVQADADVLLVDEVLAVGDASFARKCMDVFQERRNAGTTIVLVTHDMGTVQSLCHRAMLIEDGVVAHIGDPEETALEYQRLNFAGEPDDRSGTEAPANQHAEMGLNATAVSATLRDEAGQPVQNVEAGRPIRLDALLEARRELEDPFFLVNVVNEDGVVVGGLTSPMERRVARGGRMRLTGRIENPLVPGRYFLDCWIRQPDHEASLAVQGIRLLAFVVYGTDRVAGIVELEGELSPRPEESA